MNLTGGVGGSDPRQDGERSSDAPGCWDLALNGRELGDLERLPCVIEARARVRKVAGLRAAARFVIASFQAARWLARRRG